MSDPFASLPPEVGTACRAAIEQAERRYRAWITQQFELLEQAEGAGPAAQRARQYLQNGRGVRVFLKREIDMAAKAVINATALLARNPDSLSAIVQLELSRRLHDDAVAQVAARSVGGIAEDAASDEPSKSPLGNSASPAHPTAIGVAISPSSGSARPIVGRSGSSVLERLAARRSLKGHSP